MPVLESRVMTARHVLLFAVLPLVLLRVGAAQEARRPAQAALPAERCTAILHADRAGFPNTTVRFESAVQNAARAAQGNSVALPEHCEVVGALNERIGFNSQRYAIRFRMRLPSPWNGRFFFQGGGGSNGNIGDALGNLQGQQRTNALALGYAVVSQDSGHDNAVNNAPNLNGAATFGFDPQARLDFAYNSYDQVTQTAKALVRAYYGRSPERSDHAGCSEGGREGMLMSQRFPDYYDGILSCAPGFNIPRAVLAQVSDFQAFAQAARTSGVHDRFGQPFVNKVFTDEELAMVSAAVLDACDELDGAKDGLVADFVSCKTTAVRPHLASLTCKGPKRTTCLSAAQVTALVRVFDGPRTSAGEPLYSDWPWDAGIGGRTPNGYTQGWRIWSLERKAVQPGGAPRARPRRASSGADGAPAAAEQQPADQLRRCRGRRRGAHDQARRAISSR